VGWFNAPVYSSLAGDCTVLPLEMSCKCYTLTLFGRYLQTRL
jgi:hypothetical protein